MASAPLPDPQWSQAASVCIACGYSLEGLPQTGQCPECGATYEAFQLVLWGVPRTSSHTSGMRRLFWILIITAAVVHAHGWAFELMLGGVWLASIVTVFLAGAIVTMLVTGPRERRGTERFIITPGGIARVAAKFDPASRRLDTVFIPWGAADTFSVERISPFWKRLRVGRLGEDAGGPMRDVVFDAGIRCPDDSAAPVETAIRSNMQSPRPQHQQ
jgi:hypothetical protein